jgi:hypothetical protein
MLAKTGFLIFLPDQFIINQNYFGGKNGSQRN